MARKKPGQKHLDKLNFFLNQRCINEFAGNKTGFRIASMTFLRQLVKDVGQTLSDKWEEPSIREHKVSFNPGGPAVPGDPSLYFMTNKGTGVAVYVSEGYANNGEKLRCYTIASMKDYRGGPNNWLSVNVPYDEIVGSIARMAA